MTNIGPNPFLFLIKDCMEPACQGVQCFSHYLCLFIFAFVFNSLAFGSCDILESRKCLLPERSKTKLIFSFKNHFYKLPEYTVTGETITAYCDGFGLLNNTLESKVQKQS